MGRLILALWFGCLLPLAVHATAVSYVFVQGELRGVDTQTGKVVASAPVSVDVTSIATDPQGRYVYLADPRVPWRAEPGGILVLDALTLDTVKRIALDITSMVLSVARDGRTLYVARPDVEGGGLWIIDAKALEVSKTMGFDFSGLIAADASSHHVWVATGWNVVRVSREDGTVDQTVRMEMPDALAVDPLGRYLIGLEPVFLSKPTLTIVSRLTGATRRVEVDLGSRTLVIGPDGNTAYVGRSVDLGNGRIEGRIIVVRISEGKTLGEIAIPAGAGSMAFDPGGRDLWVLAPGVVNVVDIEQERVRTTLASSNSFNRGAFVGPALAPPDSAAVIEFYHTGLDHFFITQSDEEIRALDDGRFNGWIRTGGRFSAFGAGTSTAGLNPVCRFYGLPSAGLDSHFYSASPDECKAVEQRFPLSWSKEADDVFRLPLPEPDGSCPKGTQPVYRLWNARPDGNHRYTTVPAARDAMKAAGYVSEGLGSGGVAMCAPTVALSAAPA